MAQTAAAAAAQMNRQGVEIADSGGRTHGRHRRQVVVMRVAAGVVKTTIDGRCRDGRHDGRDRAVAHRDARALGQIDDTRIARSGRGRLREGGEPHVCAPAVDIFLASGAADAIWRN